jgi:hypothetical protein
MEGPRTTADAEGGPKFEEQVIAPRYNPSFEVLPYISSIAGQAMTHATNVENLLCNRLVDNSPQIQIMKI